MKKWIAGLAFVLVIGGCTNVGNLLDVFKQQNPGVGTAMVDEDGDGLADVAIVIDKYGAGVIDANTGAVAEIPGVRASIDAAKATDSLISEELQLWAALLGIPGVGLAGGLIGRFKPAQRYALWKSRFDEVVGSVQAARDEMTPEAKAEMNKNVIELSLETRKALLAAKAEYEAVKKAV